MSKLNIIRAWKDEEYRQSLSEAERKQLPDHPAGLIELTDAEMEAVAGGFLAGDFRIREEIIINLPTSTC